MAKLAVEASDEMCLTPIDDLATERVYKFQARENTSEALLACRLNVTKALVSGWQRREKRGRRFAEAPHTGGDERSRGGRVP